MKYAYTMLCSGRPLLTGRLGALRSVPSECPQGVEELWRRCTLQDPGERPSASAVLEALLALLHVKRPPQALTNDS